MTVPDRVMRSAYMQWAKEQTRVRYNLASSGVANYPLSDLHARIGDLEITGNSYYGYAPVVQAIAHHARVSRDRVFSTLGTSLANHIAMAVLAEPGGEILVEHPTYELLLSTARYLQLRIKRFPRRAENGFQISPSDIESNVSRDTKVIVVTNLHNPSSVLTSEETLSAIGDIARRVGASVLVDEVYLDAAFDLQPRSAVHLGKEFVATGSLTKVYGLSGLRCGWVLADAAMIERMWHLHDLFAVIQPHAAEQLSVLAFRKLDRIRARARSIIEENRKCVNELLTPRHDLECFLPGFGPMLFARVKTCRVEDLCEHLLQNHETAITPGRFFEMEEFIRIGLGLDPSSLRRGVEKLCLALDSMGRRD